MTDIDKLLQEAEYGLKGNFVENKITEEAVPFWVAVKKRITEDNIKMKPYSLCRILKENYGIKISETAMTNYLEKLNNGE
tara:strand:- start:444 stop:683 length:240 start_codon:yes stop_codon:yes gene_type:complete